MNKEKRRVPKLRFPGFTEDWEQRKLGNLYKRVNERNDGTLGRDKWISVAKMYFQDPDKVQSNNLDTRTYVMKKGDIAFEGHPNNEFKFGRFVLNDIGTGIISELFPIYRPITEYDLDFWKYAIQLERVMAPIFAKSITSSGNSSNKLDHNHFLNQELLVPNIDEQKKIGTLLSILSKNITLHQRKLEHLNLKKKALLQKLFPKNGARYPELRFPGFTDAWEQRKLNEFLSVSNFKNIDNKYNKNDVLSVSGDYGIVNQIEFQGRSFAGVSVSNYGLVETGDIVYTKSPLKLNPYGIIKANRINAGIVSTLYAIYKTKKNCDSKFIEHYFNLDSRLNKYLKPLVNKGAKNDMKVSSENALIGEVCFPHVTEQKLIAVFLDRLDLFITLHQRKLEHLQLQKKALLQQMFV